MRRRRFRKAWRENRDIFQAVSLGILAGFLVNLLAEHEYVGEAVAVLVAVVAFFVKTHERGSEHDPVPGDPAEERASPWRFPLIGLEIAAMIGLMAIPMLLLPRWISEWIEYEILVFFLTLITTTSEALGPPADRTP
jgi:hypothetical protein